eukprot:scaffold4118_cov257-Pinguiococcus_pyrenoidosus.AAC.3
MEPAVAEPDIPWSRRSHPPRRRSTASASRRGSIRLDSGLSQTGSDAWILRPRSSRRTLMLCALTLSREVPHSFLVPPNRPGLGAFAAGGQERLVKGGKGGGLEGRRDEKEPEPRTQ